MIKTALLVLVLLGSTAAAQVTAPASPNAPISAELRGFYEAYAEDIVQQRRESIANRYDARGVYFLGNGAKALETFEENKRFYMTRWSGPKTFTWKDIEFEVITPTAVNVIARFEWGAEKDAKPKSCSYSGLVLKISGQWRIRIEDESCPPK